MFKLSRQKQCRRGRFFIMHLDNSINTDYESNVLVDRTKNGNERPWREKKLANVGYWELLHILEFKKQERVRDCADVLEFKADQETGERKLYRVWFCKSRLCPMCNWRRTMKHGVQSQRVIAEVIRRKPKARWLFLTLTVKNVYDGDSLNKSLSDMAKGFNKLKQYKKVKRNLVGFMRATEVTVNSADNSYNQHMHVLLCVENTYFKNTDNYINQKQWVGFWKKAMQLDYEPNVKVQSVKPKDKGKDGMKSAIDETAKYPVKDTDFLTDDRRKNLNRLRDLEEGLYRKRLLSYGGLLKTVHKELNLDDSEDGDLLHTDDEDEADEEGYSIIAKWNWERQNYYIRNDI